MPASSSRISILNLWQKQVLPAFQALQNSLSTSGRNARSERILWWSVALFTLLKLWLISDQNLSISANEVFDDRLYMDLANYLIQGKWLGPFGSETLIRGLFFPAWIALMYYLHIPLLLSFHLLYLGGILIFLFACKPMLPNAYLRLIVFIFLLFNPMSYNEHILAVRRAALYTGLTTLIFTLALVITHRLQAIRKIPWVLTCLWSLSLSGFWLTREEGIWIIPAVLLLQLGWLVLELKESGKRWLIFAVFLATPYLILNGANLIVSWINHSHYGVFYTSELKSSGLPRAVKTITRLGFDPNHPDIPISTALREKLYLASPSFATLKPYLEGDIGALWAKTSSVSWNKPDDGELRGNWFVWALRSAAKAAGHYESATQAHSFYQRIRKELDQACQEDKLKSQSAFRYVYAVPKILQEFFNLLNKTICLKGFSPHAVSSKGEYPYLLYSQLLTKSNLADLTNQTLTQYTFWTFHESQPLDVRVKDEYNNEVGIVVRQHSPDVHAYFNEFPTTRLARFAAYVPDIPYASLHISMNNQEILQFPLNNLYIGMPRLLKPPLYFNIETILPVSYPLQQQTKNIEVFKLSSLQAIGFTYKKLLPWITAIVMLLFLIRLAGVIRKKDYSVLFFFTAALFTAIVARLMGLAVYMVFLGNGWQPRLLAPAYPLLLLFFIMAVVPWHKAHLSGTSPTAT
jgi:hypothetical protein